MFYAHSKEGKPQSEWHTLENHLKATAELAQEFASEFGCGEWGYIAGLWHDLGKYSREFQQMLLAVKDSHIETRPGIIDHSSAGAIHAQDRFGIAGRIFSYIVAGHHAGLTDWQTEIAAGRSLIQRLQKRSLLQDIPIEEMPSSILEQPFPQQKFPTKGGHALWVRMLYSCMVDADFLDTESFMDPQKCRTRRAFPTLHELLTLYDAYIEEKQAGADPTLVNKKRAEILQRCIEMANHHPSIFTLTVPTGGGKTLSSMGFALNHAKKYGKTRIIYVIPYTSIIEQTANQFREIFKDAVVEHHSNVDVADETMETAKSRLACENWDAPVIVTTSVQFFDSLFSNRSSRCRKLHNIVNSIVILDEVQLLPPEFLKPILLTIKELWEKYKVTFVLSTATQPAFSSQTTMENISVGLTDTVEIMGEPESLYKAFKRVNVSVPENPMRPCGWKDLAHELSQHESVLCVVNRRDDCRRLYELMPRNYEST